MEPKSHRDQQLRGHRLYSLSQNLRKGERIDFFLSHSWQDDPTQKLQIVQSVADAFQAQHGRMPSFWLDAVCFNQLNIAASLKCLPVNVLSCKKVLALAGPTYVSRLWCIWELYTRLVFVEMSVAIESHIQFEILGSDHDKSTILHSLKHFNLSETKCYDPNEESHVRSVIETGGEADFIKHIGAIFQNLTPQI